LLAHPFNFVVYGEIFNRIVYRVAPEREHVVKPEGVTVDCVESASQAHLLFRSLSQFAADSCTSLMVYCIADTKLRNVERPYVPLWAATYDQELA
jgi:hypothetical protein